MTSAFAGLRVLVVDDNIHMRTLMRSLLLSVGINQVLEATDGAQAFALLGDYKPDVIVSDLSMEPVDGIAFTQMVRTRSDSPNPFVPIIMVTGHTERSRVEAARDAGVTEFVAKPITSQNLTARITQVIDRPRPFVRSDGYVGPDRRRKAREDYDGPWRRGDDSPTAGKR